MILLNDIILIGVVILVGVIVVGYYLGNGCKGNCNQGRKDCDCKED